MCRAESDRAASVRRSVCFQALVLGLASLPVPGREHYGDVPEPTDPARIAVPTAERSLVAEVFRVAANARSLHNALFQNGFKFEAADGRELVLRGNALALLSRVADLRERKRVGRVALTTLMEAEQLKRSTVQDAVDRLCGYGLLARVGSGARYGLTKRGVEVAEDWARYRARYVLTEHARQRNDGLAA